MLLSGASIRVCFLLVCFAGAAAAAEYTFRLSRAAEVIAEIEAASPGADWAVTGREAGVLRVTAGGKKPQQVVLYAGAEAHRYRVFLGRFPGGEHRLRVEKDAQLSAREAGAVVQGVHFEMVTPEEAAYEVVAHAPVIHPRPGPFGRFSDIPLVSYCERLASEEGYALEYTVIFSNEDGGTSTRALMARWGRTTDIEFVYRVEFGAGGEVRRRKIQSKDHEVLEFNGGFDDLHPLLQVSTMNNMVSAEVKTDVRYQPAPVGVNLQGRARESLMDEFPVTWTVMRKELEREGKLRPFGTVENEKISDPRHYLFLEFENAPREAATAIYVRRQGERVWRSSHLGRSDLGIERAGVVRTTVEMPPGGNALEQIAELGFACVQREPKNGKAAGGGDCEVKGGVKAFVLDQEGRPARTVTWAMPKGAGLRIAAGEMRTLAPRRAR